MNFPPFQYPGSKPQIFKTTVSAAANYRLIDFNIPYLADRFSISWRVGQGNLRFKVRNVILNNLGVFSITIGLIDGIGAFLPGLYVKLSLIIYPEDSS
ncbi:unnamed protein product, partial [marine sediment metagenome]